MNLMFLNEETLSYGQNPVLQKINFTLSPGERVVLLGRSGSGKTTLLNRVYAQLISAQTRVALVPQDLALVPQLSTLKNTLMGRLDDHGPFYNLTNLVHTRQADRTEITKILTDLGLQALTNRSLETLSGGQKQRTALARAFFRGGDVLIGDEPVTGVDESQAAMLLTQIRTRFATCVLALHDVALARQFATRLIGIHNGKIMFDAPPGNLSADQIAALYED